MEFVYPKDNEEFFISIAEKIGLEKICFIYYSPNPDILKKVKTLQNRTKITILTAKEANNKSKTDLTISRSYDPVTTRNLIEKGKADYILGMEFHKEKDYMRQMNSGMNHVLAKLAKQKKVSFAFPFNEWLELSEKQRCVVLARFMQNVSLYKKYNLKVEVSSFTDSAYGMRPEMQSFERLFQLKN